jgi:hypothetical protein
MLALFVRRERRRERAATVFNVFASTLEKVHEPIFAPIEFQLDIAARRARLVVSGVTEGRGRWRPSDQSCADCSATLKSLRRSGII